MKLAYNKYSKSVILEVIVTVYSAIKHFQIYLINLLLLKYKSINSLTFIVA